jgi:hypothetical protein
MTPVKSSVNFDLPATERGSSRAFWLCQTVGWSFYVLTLLFFYVGYRPKTESLVHSLLMNGSAILFAALLGICLTQGWRRFLRKSGWIRRGGIAIIAKLALGICVLAAIEFSSVLLFYVTVRPMSDADLHEWLRDGMPGTIIGWFVIYLVWTVLYVAIVMRRHAVQAEIEKLTLELNVKDAELRALQAQVNPHFFFNSLNSIRALLYQDAQAAADVIDRLAGMMRYTLQSGRSDTVPLAEEMEAVRNYLAIEKIRFEERLQLSESIEQGLEQMALPPMALQTLVENAVKYGVECSVAPCELRISAKREGDQMQLMVSNQGHLRESTQGSTKVGVQNTGKRLALLFGTQAGIDLFEDNGWVNARLTLPCKSLVA